METDEFFVREETKGHTHEQLVKEIIRLRKVWRIDISNLMKRIKKLEDQRRLKMEIYPGYGWDEDTEKLERQLQELRHPQAKMIADIEKRRQKHRAKLRKEIKKLGGVPVL